MVSIDSNKFSASDLCLFIDSIEKISRMECKKRERKQQRRAQRLAKALRNLDQQSVNTSSTLSSTDRPHDESLSENVEQKEISYEYAGAESIFANSSSNEENNVEYNSSAFSRNEYCEIDATKDNNISNYTQPLDCLESTKMSTSSTPESTNSSEMYENISAIKSQSTESFSSAEYVEPLEYTQEPLNKDSARSDVTEATKKRSLKKCLLGLVRRNYRKHFSFNSNNWSKSNSWMQLTVA